MIFFPSISSIIPFYTSVEESYSKTSLTETIQQSKLFYKNHSDLISSVTNLALNTLLLISKLTDRIPSIIPRMASTGLGFSGLICINMMVRDCTKHFRDCRYAWKFGNYGSLVLAAARVHVKAINTLLLLSGSLNTVVALAGFTSLHKKVIRIATPIALIALIGTISGEFIDYACKSTLLGRLDKISKEGGSEEKVKMIAKHFLILAYHPPFGIIDAKIALDSLHQEEQQLAVEIIMQMEEWSLEMLKQDLSRDSLNLPYGNDREIVFSKVRGTLQESQIYTQEKIYDIALGYISMALCKAYPYTILQYSLNWVMSLRYTMNLINKKLDRGSASS